MTQDEKVEYEALRARVKKQPIIQAFLLAVESVQPDMGGELREAMERPGKDAPVDIGEMPKFLDSLDAELAALQSPSPAPSEDPVEAIIEWLLLQAVTLGGVGDEKRSDALRYAADQIQNGAHNKAALAAAGQGEYEQGAECAARQTESEETASATATAPNKPNPDGDGGDLVTTLEALPVYDLIKDVDTGEIDPEMSHVRIVIGLRDLIIQALRTAAGGEELRKSAFKLGERVTKKSGSSWTGRVVGFYSTTLNPDGVCVESETETGSVQIYPAKALRTAGQGDFFAENAKKPEPDADGGELERYRTALQIIANPDWSWAKPEDMRRKAAEALVDPDGAALARSGGGE